MKGKLKVMLWVSKTVDEMVFVAAARKGLFEVVLLADLRADAELAVLKAERKDVCRLVVRLEDVLVVVKDDLLEEIEVEWLEFFSVDLKVYCWEC